MNETMPPPAVSDNTDGSVAVPPGYKRTEVGIIPEEWTVASLGEIATIATGNTPPTHDPTNYGDEYPFVSPTDLGETKYVADTDKKLSKKGFEASRRFPANSILFVSIGSTIGKCGIAPVELTSNQQINAVFPSCDFSTDYLYYILCSVAPRIRALAGEQAVPIVNKTQFSETVVPLPPLLEQRAIAALLSDADGFIGALDALIEKKRAIKQAAMQQLLTGKKRLPGFEKNPDYKNTEVGMIPEDWRVVKVGAIANILRGASPRPIDSPVWFDEHSSTGWLRISDVTSADKYLMETTQCLSSAGIANSRLVKPDNLVMSICATVGRPIIIKKEVCIHDGFVVFEGLNANKEYLYYILLSIEMDWSKHGQTGSQMNLNTGLIISTLIPLPAPEEQTAIAAVLSDMDAEIAALERRREKTKQIKQGMMQQLLTGRIRLPSVGRVSA